MNAITDRMPMKIGHIAQQTFHNGQDWRVTHRTATANYLYIVRQQGQDLYGPTPDFAVKAADLAASGRVAPINGPSSSFAGAALWQAADINALGSMPTEPTAFHIIVALPVKIVEKITTVEALDGWYRKAA